MARTPIEVYGNHRPVKEGSFSSSLLIGSDHIQCLIGLILLGIRTTYRTCGYAQSTWGCTPCSQLPGPVDTFRLVRDVIRVHTSPQRLHGTSAYTITAMDTDLGIERIVIWQNGGRQDGGISDVRPVLGTEKEIVLPERSQTGKISGMPVREEGCRGFP